MPFVDTHCHLNDQRAFPNPSEAVRQANEAGVQTLIVVGVDVESSQRAVTLADQLPGVFAVVGWHPNYTQNMNAASLGPIRGLLSHPKVVALGEIGLDYHWDHATKDVQKSTLHAQLDLAAELDVPVVFHCREAYPDLLDILESRDPRPYLFHCFAGTSEDAHRAVRLGGMFGVDGPVTYPRSDGLRSCLREIGLERILLETDSPYMAPVPYRGKPNSPANIPLIAEGVAQALGVTLKDVEKTTTENAARFFRNRF